MVLSSMQLQKVSVTLRFRRIQCLVLRSVLSVFVDLRSAECVCRAVSVALHTPQLGGPRSHRGPKIPGPSPLSTPEKASIPQIEI